MPRRNGVGIDLLADPTRRRIVALLALSQSKPTAIARELGLTKQAISRQLRILLQAGLIRYRRDFTDARGRAYYIEPRRLGQITAWLAGTEVGRVFPYFERDRFAGSNEDGDLSGSSSWAERNRGGPPAERLARGAARKLTNHD